MKVFVLFVSLIFLQNTFAVNSMPFVAPDIIVDSKLDFNWSEILFNKVRRLMKNYGYPDPLKSTLDTDIVLVDSLTSELISPSTKDFLTDLSDMIGLKLVNARTKIVMRKLSYDIGSITTDIKTQKKQGMIISGDFLASAIKVGAQEIRLSIEIQKNNNQFMPVVEVVIHRPRVETNQEDKLGFNAQIKIDDSTNILKFNVISSSFENMATYLSSNLDKVMIDFGRFEIPEINVLIGNRKITVSAEKVEKFIRDRESSIKTLLGEQFVKLLDQGIGQSVLKTIEETSIPREYWLNGSDVQGQVMIGKITSSLFAKNLEVNLPGDFCTRDKYDQYKTHCVQQKKTLPIKGNIDQGKHEQSLKSSKEKLLLGESNMVASVSEDYINKLLVTTYDAGFWDEFLKEKKLELGPKKASVLLDQEGESGTLYMDLIYTPSKFQGILLGRKRIRFPLVMKVSIRIEEVNDVPVLIIRLNDMDLSKKTLLSGLDLKGIESSINDIPRFKKLVIKTIQTEAKKVINTDVLTLPFQELRGLGLETVKFRSDGEGRMAAFLKLEDIVSAEK